MVICIAEDKKSCEISVGERILHMAQGLPPFLHFQVSKPWWIKLPEERGARGYFNRLYLDLSPHTLEARRFMPDLAEDLSWTKPRLRIGFMLRIAGMGSIPLVGLPMTICADLLRFLKMLKRWRHTSNWPCFGSAGGKHSNDF